MKRTFVGFGFGPIQSGLFLTEAWLSGNFDRYVISEIDAKMVDLLQRNDGAFYVNIAREGEIAQIKIEGVEIYNPTVKEDKEKIVQAVAESPEMATALPSVNIFDKGNPSVVELIAEGLKSRKEQFSTCLYTAENNNHAAEILEEKLYPLLTPEAKSFFQTLNTVVGKMSGVIDDFEDIERLKLQRILEGKDRAILVEDFNRILITSIKAEDYQRGIRVFEEKDDLYPFEEAKLYGHNAIHALIAYLSDLRGYTAISDAREDSALMEFARTAFYEESGGGLVKKWNHLNDPLFTNEGFKGYADDLLKRMTNPLLFDLVERVARDPRRKLGWNDRLIGTMRLCLSQGGAPKRMAVGAAAAVAFFLRREPGELPIRDTVPEDLSKVSSEFIEKVLTHCWSEDEQEGRQEVIDRVIEAWPVMLEFKKSGELPADL